MLREFESIMEKISDLTEVYTNILLSVAEQFRESYLTHILLPMFLVAVGENADFKFFPSTVQSRIRGLRPQTLVAERLATMYVLPILLVGVLRHHSKHEELTQYLRNLFTKSSGLEGQRAKHEIVNSVRFIGIFEEHHSMIFNILWELVVPYIDAKVASTHVLPALVTFGSDQNLNVKYASIDAFGAIVDKIRVQMDAFLEDGSVEATIAVVRALAFAVPHTTDRLRESLVQDFSIPTASPIPSNDIVRWREEANAFCESICALEATDLPSSSVRNFLLPVIQNLLKDSDALDPAHEEALEIILRERSGGTLDAISKVMGAHIGLASSVTSFFGDSGLLGKRESAEPGALPPETIEPLKPALQLIMRGSFTDMPRGKTKSNEENSSSH